MGTKELDKKVAFIVDQLVERFNLAISTAVDEKKSFDQGEEIFLDTIAVLEYYDCGDIATEQIINFSKVAFFRKEYKKALAYGMKAVDVSKTNEKKETAYMNLHEMSFKLLEILLVTTEDLKEQVTFEDIQEFLTTEDYCVAMRNTYAARKKIKTDEDKEFLAGVLNKLSKELMRQGVRQEKCGNNKDAVLLFRTVTPFLPPKKAKLVTAEIEKMEAI